jgi:soluble lytic murein transglycosylase-like protein
MVTARLAPTVAVLGLALAAGPAQAQAPAHAQAQAQAQAQTRAESIDWRPAGGDLFAAAPDTPNPALSAVPAPPNASHPTDPARLTPPLQPYGEAVAEASRRHGLDPKLLHAVVVVESAYRPDACSPAGACGLTQLMPGTARDLGVHDRFDPVESLRGGADYLARQIRRFGDLRLALAAYNAGPQRVARLGRIPDIAETRLYVVAVVDCYLALTAGRTIRAARDCVAPTTPGLHP